MKIAIRAGHNEQATGCAALINEVQEDRNLLPHIIQTLREFGNEVLDVTPGRMDRDSDLSYGVRKANEWGADLFVSIHFNKAYNHYNGKIGAECWVYSKSDNITLDEQVAQRIVDKLAGAGFVGDNKQSRGVKVSNELYELKQTKMAAVIVETCFVEATGDVELYKRLGHKKMGQLIAEGIANKSVNNNSNTNNSNNVNVKEEYKMKYAICYCNEVDERSAKLLRDYLGDETQALDARIKMNWNKFAEKGLINIGGNSTSGWGFSSYATHWIKGDNRYLTAQLVSDICSGKRKLDDFKVK